MLDKDHHDLDERLSVFVSGANKVLSARLDRTRLQDQTGLFHTTLAELERLLDRHLIDEEDLIVPVILKYGADDIG